MAPPTSTGRTSFDELYDQPDPRSYFRALAPLDYQIPHHAQGIFRQILSKRQQGSGLAGPVNVLDIGCSYGITAALLNHDIALKELSDHYTSPQVETLGTADLLTLDRAYYRAHLRSDAVPVVGVDIAPNPVSYSREVGLHSEAFAENLEAGPPSPALREAIRCAQLITITGAISFLSPRTFESLIDGVVRPAWIAAFVLRTGSYRPIAESLARKGMITERFSRTFRQRRFTGLLEQQYAIDAVSSLGDDPKGKESEGYYHATLYLSRPADDAARFPFHSLLETT